MHWSAIKILGIRVDLPQFIYLPAGAEFDDSDDLITTDLGRQLQLVCVDETDEYQPKRLLPESSTVVGGTGPPSRMRPLPEMEYDSTSNGES